MTPTFFLSLLLLFFKLETLQTCVFPSYLQTPRIDGELKPWKTRVWWIHVRSDEPKWKQRGEIFVVGSSIWHQQETDYITCEKKTRRVTPITQSVGKCVTRTLLYNRTCIEQDGNKFKVLQIAQYSGSDRPVATYLCMMFVKRSDTIVQVWQGTRSKRNEGKLCDGGNMTLDKWPWIATWTPRASVCQVSGAFTFRTISRLTNQDICEKEWRQSKLEIECLHGDGMEFISPKGSECNPFLKDGEHKRLYCWGGWEHGNFIYMVAGSEGKNEPQFCIRFPKKMDGEFVALVYFSVICPNEPDGQPPSGYDYYELHLKRHDPYECADDNEELCKKLAVERAICEKGHKRYVSHCRKTCKLCVERQEQLSTQCPFDEKLHGVWALYNIGQEENIKIKINKTVIHFSNFGDLVCKQRIQKDNKQYKVISTFGNGCPARYSCVELYRRNNNILQYRISKSHRDEDATNMCEFNADPAPMFDTFRSASMKNLILAGKLWDFSCGLTSSIPFNGTFESDTCRGYMSDWDDVSCTYRGVLKVQSKNCGSLFSSRQYQCLLHIDEDDLYPYKYLITRSMDGRNDFNCWIFSARHQPRKVYQMPTPQCSFTTEFFMHFDRRPKAILNLYDDRASNSCVEEPLPPPTKVVIANLTGITTEMFQPEVHPYFTNKSEVVLPVPQGSNNNDPWNISSKVGSSWLTLILSLLMHIRYA